MSGGMGGLYTLEYFTGIIGQLRREFEDCRTGIAEEKSGHYARWQSRILNVVEMTLLFHEHETLSTVFLSNENIVLSWRETFFKVWDGDWQDTHEKYEFAQRAFRVQHRPAVMALFARLDSITRYWRSAAHTGASYTFTPLLPGYPLPFFSIQRHERDGIKYVIAEDFTNDLIQHLVRDIIFRLAPETRSHIQPYDIQEVWCAVDALALLCQAYEQSSGIEIQFIRAWRNTTLDIAQSFIAAGQPWSDTLMQAVTAAFDRLEAVAAKYPPNDTGEAS